MEARPAIIAEVGLSRGTSLSNGWSWIELMAVVAMLGFPGDLLCQLAKYRLSGAAQQLLGDVLAARMQAVSRRAWLMISAGKR